MLSSLYTLWPWYSALATQRQRRPREQPWRMAWVDDLDCSENARRLGSC